MFLSHYVKPKVAIIFVATSSGVMFELFIFVIFTFGNVLSSSPSWLTNRCSLKVLSNSFREKSTSRFEGLPLAALDEHSVLGGFLLKRRVRRNKRTHVY